MPPVLKTYLIASELTGRPTTEEEFRKRLQFFSRSAAVRLCSILNMLLSKWAGDYDFEAHARLVRSLFPPPTAAAIIQTQRLAFHRHQLLFVAQEALRYCDDDARDMSTPYWGGFGVVLLMASDLLNTAFPSGGAPSEDLARKICRLLPDMEANGLQSYQTKIVRSYTMTSRFIESFRGKGNFFDVPKLFEAAVGVPLETYQALVFGSISRFAKLHELKRSPNPADFAIPKSWFKQTSVPPETTKRFFDYVSASSDAFAKIVAEKKPHSNDFTVFRDKPLFGESRKFFPLDLALLAEKFESGPFWRVHNQLPNGERENFHSFWGSVFEAYVNWVMSNSVDGKTNRFYSDPRYAGKPEEQVCDGIVICGRCAILLEYKSSTFTVVGKYGGNPSQLDVELRTKLVGTAKSRKGVFQLADAVEKLCRPENPAKIEGVDMYEVSTVFPLLIIRDDMGSAFFMNTYLNWHFQEMIKGKRFLRSVTPLFCLSADDIEKLSPFLRDSSLAEVLSARYKPDKNLKSSFWTVENSVLARKGERLPSLLVDQTEKLGEMIATRLGLKDS
jgi:hypothetical protein